MSRGAPGDDAAGALAASREAFQARAYERAARLARSGLARSPECAALHGVLAASLLAARRPALALQACDRALALEAEAAWPSCLRALALSELRCGADGEAAAERAVALAPEDPWARDALARAGAAAGRLPEARGAAREAVRLAPRDPDLVRRLGDAWLAEDAAAAEARYREAIALDPRNAAHWDALSGALVRQLRDEDAAAARGRAAELDPAFAERYRRQRAFVPLLQLGAALFLAVVTLSVAPRALPPRAARIATAAMWVMAVLAPVLFAVGAALALQRGPRHPPPPDPLLAEMVRRLR